jgi:hypothetical protein
MNHPPGPRPFSTHGVSVEEGIAVKRFRSQVDGDERRLYGDEPRREWRALKLLARYAPGLAPKPIRADLDADPPLIAMSQVPGEPLGTRPVTEAQEDAIAAALSVRITRFRRQCSERLSERQAARHCSATAPGTWRTPATPRC